MIKEPGSRFIRFVIPTNGTGKEITKAMTDYLSIEDYSLDHLVAIGGDGTSTNTGNKKE